MSNAAKSMFVFGIYLTGLGLSQILVPDFVCSIAGFPHTESVWLRVVGMLVLFLAFFGLMSAREEATNYFRWSIYTRSTVIFFFTAFVLMKLINPVLILFGLVDLLAAAWTWLALCADKAVLSPSTI